MEPIKVLMLILTALIPVVASIGFTFLEKFTAFKKISRIPKGIITGLIFGGISILGTVLAVPTVSGALINVRDASPIICGLMFGGEAGIVAGFIGGLYRFVSVYFTGVGAFTQIACSVSTFMAGVFTAIIRYFIFDKKHGTWYYGFFLGVLIEDFHMAMVFLTHPHEIQQAYEVVQACLLPMVLANSLSVMVAVLVLSLHSKEKLVVVEKKRHVATKVQLTLLVALLISYACTATFSHYAIKNVVHRSTETEARHSIDDVQNNVNLLVDEFLTEKVEEVADAFDVKIKECEDNHYNNQDTIDFLRDYMNGFLDKYSEINIVDKDELIVISNVSSYVLSGFKMSSGTQSSEFSVLNDDSSGVTVFVQEIQNNEADKARVKYAGAKLSGNSYGFGYIQIGLYEDKYHELLNSKVENSANYRHIKENGFIVVTDTQGHIVSSSENSSFAGTVNIKKIENEDVYRTGKNSYYVYYDQAEGYYIIGFAEVHENDLPIDIGFSAISLAEVFVFLLLYAVLYIIVKRTVVDRITTVSEGLNEISSGNLDVKINERNSYEFNSLSDDINKTVTTLKGYIEKEANKNAEELKFAKNIQHSVLPTVFPLNDKFEIFASMDTAKLVGGDFYDFYYVDHEHILIQIADVSGKGIPAAMFMMQAKSMIKSLIESGMDLDVAFTEANRRLCEGNETQTFITAWAGIVDLSSGHVEFVNAGHNPPLICRDGKFEYLKTRADFVLAGMEGFKYHKQSFDIKPGDVIYLYTDGVTEATDNEMNLFGEERLLNAISTIGVKSAQEICSGVLTSVNEFVNGAEQSDDITMLGFNLYNCETSHIKVVEAKIDNLHEVIDFIDDLLERNGASTDSKMKIDVAVDELFSNIAFYAYPEGQIGKAKVSIDFNKENDEAIIVFEDRGRPYNPLEKKDPDTSVSLEKKEIGGLGIFIVKNTMDSMEYENVNGHNVLTLKKKLH